MKILDINEPGDADTAKPTDTDQNKDVGMSADEHPNQSDLARDRHGRILRPGDRIVILDDTR